jgi:hypothetical protein
MFYAAPSRLSVTSFYKSFLIFIFQYILKYLVAGAFLLYIKLCVDENHSKSPSNCCNSLNFTNWTHVKTTFLKSKSLYYTHEVWQLSAHSLRVHTQTY